MNGRRTLGVLGAGGLAMVLALLCPAGVASGSPVRVTSHRFAARFNPDQVVGADGSIWLVGEQKSCAVRRLNPKTMVVGAPLSTRCGFNAVAGDGAVFVESATYVASTDNQLVQIERVPTNGTGSPVRFLTPMTVVGSAIAHTQLALADGYLWLYGHDPPGGNEVVQLSPTTGAVVRTISGMPPIGGVEPLISAGPGGVWFAGGAGGGSTMARIDPVSGQVLNVQLAGGVPSVTWLSQGGRSLWAAVITPSSDTTPQVGERIDVIDTGGQVIRHSPTRPLGSFGDSELSGGSDHWTVGPSPTCGQRQLVQRVDAPTLKLTVIDALEPPMDPCLSDSAYRQTATADGDLFILDATGGVLPAILYRVTP